MICMDPVFGREVSSWKVMDITFARPSDGMSNDMFS